jgi:predicted GNAT family acetyltransferase
MIDRLESHGRLEMDFAGATVFARCRQQPGRLIIDHVEADPALRGSGASGVFMTALAERAQARGERLRPLCGYAATWLRRHSAYAALIE